MNLSKIIATPEVTGYLRGSNGSNMRHLLLSLLLITAFAIRVDAQIDAPASGADAYITILIPDLTADEWQHLQERVGKEREANIEYGCLTTGVVVLRLQHLQVSEKGDVIAVVNRILNDAHVKGTARYLDVHVEPQSGNKC